MGTREIPRDRWTEFFDATTRRYLGRRVSVELLGVDLGDQLIAERRSFAGIGKDVADQPGIEIFTGEGVGAEKPLLAIPDPTRIQVLEEASGRETIQIESEASGTTLVELEPTPEELGRS
jgi:hypothetical protein